MTAEELLMMSDDVETYIADDALVIDPESRTILTPVNGLILGVESDKEAERVQFVCPRFVGDNIDLSELQIRTIYQNANGEKDFRISTDVSVDGDNIRFSWLLSRKVTKYKGKVKFIVCAIRTQADGTTKNEWNTTLAEGISLEGLEVDILEEEFEEPKDIVLQLLGMLDEKATEIMKEIDKYLEKLKIDNNLDVNSENAIQNKVVAKQFNRLSEEIAEIGVYRVNEFNKNDITLGKFPNTSIGQSINTFVNRENTFVCNQRWLVKKGDIIRWSWPYSAFAIYDKNGYLIEKLGSDGLKEATIQSDNAHTMVYFGTSASVYYIDNFMFTINRELPIEYVEYGVIGIDTYNDKKTNERIDEIVNTDHIPYVVLNFDNQIASLDDNVVTLLEKYSFKGSFVGWENPTVFMELLSRGWDIGTYDNSADILPSSDIIDSTDETAIAQYDNYVYQAQKKQSDIGIFNPTVWCCRQNKWGRALAKGVKKYGYKMARAYQTNDVYNLNYDKDFPVLDSQRFYTGDLSTVNGVIDNAINKPNSIVVILAHRLIDTTEEDRGFDCLASEYESMLIHLKEKADSGLIKVITFRELYRELYPNNGYENDYNRLFKMSQFDYSV